MAGRIEATLAELGITLPRPMQPIANYVPYVVTGNLVVVSGQVPAIDGRIAITGKVSWGVSIDQAKEAARLCFINVLVHSESSLRRGPGPGEAGCPPRRVRRRAVGVHPARPGDERRIRPRGRGVRRCRTPCPNHHRRAVAAGTDAAVEVEGLFEIE